MIIVKREVIEAAYRLLSLDGYPGLKLTGDQEVAQQFHDERHGPRGVRRTDRHAGRENGMKRGDHVRIRYKGREADAVVALVSENQKSIAFEFVGLLGCYLGSLPALDRGDGYRDLIENELVELVGGGA